MKDRFSSVIMDIVIFLIICVCIVFAYIILGEFKEVQTATVPENAIEVSEIKKQENIKMPEAVENRKVNVVENKNSNNETPENNTVSNPLNEIKEANNLQTENKIDYSNITVNKYFYNQLEDYSKNIYKAFEANKENMKKGTYKVELEDSFSKLLSQSNGQDALGKYYQSAIEAYTYDNPDVFYLSPNKMYLNIETTTRGSNVSYYVYIDQGDGTNYLIDEITSKEQIDSYIKNIEQVRNQILQNRKQNVYDNIKMVHDYLITNVEYDTTISKDNIYNIYGAMVNKQAVCEGYARSFKYLMDALEIPCTLVIGKGTNSEGRTENHAWNYVELQNKWYAVDCTWDDPVSMTGWVSEASKTRYFLKGSRRYVKRPYSKRTIYRWWKNI